MMVFAVGNAPVIQHVGNFSTAENCAAARVGAQASIAEFPMTPHEVYYRFFCVPASDGKAPPPN
jgi:hypothetical protein